MRINLIIPGIIDCDVADFAEASRVFSHLRDESGEGASSWPEGQLRSHGVKFARISYNGRIWDAHTEWTPDTRPLYDPCLAAYRIEPTFEITEKGREFINLVTPDDITALPALAKDLEARGFTAIIEDSYAAMVFTNADGNDLVFTDAKGTGLPAENDWAFGAYIGGWCDGNGRLIDSIDSEKASWMTPLNICDLYGVRAEQVAA